MLSILAGAGIALDIPVVALSAQRRSAALTALSVVIFAQIATFVWSLVSESAVTHQVAAVPSQGTFMFPNTMEATQCPRSRP